MAIATGKIKIAVLSVLGAVVARQMYVGMVARPATFQTPENHREIAASAAPGLPRLASSAREFRPAIPSSVNPLQLGPLRLERLARLQNVEAAGSRDIFQFVTRPRYTSRTAFPGTGHSQSSPVTERLMLTGDAQLDTVMFYGYVERRGSSRLAFFLDRDAIYMKREGETFGRYRVLRIDTQSVVIEDMSSKEQRTVPIHEPVA